jgi:hypothetical protein
VSHRRTRYRVGAGHRATSPGELTVLSAVLEAIAAEPPAGALSGVSVAMHAPGG